MSTAKELARINGRGHAHGWHAQELQKRAAREGHTMAALFAQDVHETSAFNVPAAAVRMWRGRVYYRFADGSEAAYAHQRAER